MNLIWKTVLLLLFFVFYCPSPSICERSGNIDKDLQQVIALANQQNWDSSISLLKKLSEKFPDNGEVHQLYGTHVFLVMFSL